MNKVQTDNSFLNDKVFLRLKSLPDINELHVLNAFGGDNLIWNKIKKLTNKKIHVLCIDTKDKSHVQLKGDNIKYIAGMDLNKFDIIDLDAYGVPFKQLETIFKSGWHGLIYFTFIQSGMGQLNISMLNYLGFTNVMINKCKSLFNINGFDKFKSYLSLKGISNIYYINYERKYYGYFNI